MLGWGVGGQAELVRGGPEPSLGSLGSTCVFQTPAECQVEGTGLWSWLSSPRENPAGKLTGIGSQAGRSGGLGQAQVQAVILCGLGFGDRPCQER